MPTPHDEIQSAYRRMLLLARDHGYRLNREGVERLYRAFGEALARLASEQRTGILTADRAGALRREIDVILRALQRSLVGITEDSVGRTIVDLTEIHRRATEELFRRYGAGAVLGNAFDRVPIRALAAMVSRPMNSATFQTLYQRKIARLAPEIDAFLDAAVARGVSAGRASKDLAAIMARNDPKLLKILERANVSSAAMQTGPGVIDFERYGLDEADTKAVKGLLYDARRIQVSESMNAMREAGNAAADASPTVLATQWQRSGRHSVPDVCFPAGTEITTQAGGRAIESLRIGDSVLTDKGRWRPVTRLYRCTIRGAPLVRLYFQESSGRIRELTATPNHPVLTDGGWTPAGDLQTGSAIALSPSVPLSPSCLSLCDKEGTASRGSAESAPFQLRGRTFAIRYDALRLAQTRKARTGCPCSRAPTPLSTCEVGRSPRSDPRRSTLDYSPRAWTGTCLGAAPLTFADALHPSIPASKNGASSMAGRFGRHLRSAHIFDPQADQDASGCATSPALFCRCEPERQRTAGPFVRSRPSRICGQSPPCTPSPETGLRSVGSRVLLDSPLPERSTGDYRSASRRFGQGLTGGGPRNLSELGRALRRKFRSVLSYPKYSGCGADRQYAKVIKVEVLAGVTCEVFNLEVQDDHTYVANGAVVHNCDLLATRDAYGFGEGFYPAGKFPLAPHSHCACMAGRAQFRRPKDWGKPKPEAPPMQIDPDDEAHTEGFAKDWTDKERARNQRLFAAILKETDRPRKRGAA